MNIYILIYVTYTHICINVYIYIYTSRYVYIHLHVSMGVYWNIYICTCIHQCVYIYIYVYICWYACITFQSYTIPFGTCKELLVYHRKDWEFLLWCHLEGTTSVAGTDLLVSVLRLWYLDVPLEVRINGLFHLLINGLYWGYNPLTNHLLTSWDIQVVDPYLMPEIMSHGTNDSHTCLRILSFQIGARLCLVFVQDSHSSWFLDLFEKSTCCWFGAELFSENTNTPI